MSRFRSKLVSSWTLLPAGRKYLSGRAQDTAFAPLFGMIGFGGRVEQSDARQDLSGVDWCAAQIRNKETTVRSATRFWERLPASRF